MINDEIKIVVRNELIILLDCTTLPLAEVIGFSSFDFLEGGKIFPSTAFDIFLIFLNFALSDELTL
jgi:hypothetical protein